MHNNYQKAPASPRTTRAGGAERDGHPGKVVGRGGGRRAEMTKCLIFSIF